MTPDQIIAVVTALLTGAPDPAAFPAITTGGADPRYPVTVEACPTSAVPPTEIEGGTVICGRVNVPEDHGKPDGTRIDLAFAVLKARTQSPVPDPVIYLHGGPGGGAILGLAGIVHPLFDGYRMRRDVVTFDQRAAGISSDMVTCFNTLGGNIFELLVPGAAAEGSDDKLFKECANELSSSGNDLTAYNTVQNALDVQALMLALGYTEYNIYGVSYGTTLGLEVMRSAPDGVRSVVLDSVSPPQAKVYDENIKPEVESIQAVIDQCAADTDCAKAYPDLEAVLFRVAEQLDKAPIPAARGKPEVTIQSLIDLFAKRNQFGRLPNATRLIPMILTEWDKGDTTTWDLLISGATNALPTTAQRVAPYADRLTPDQQTLAGLLLEMAANEGREDQAQAAAMQALAASLKARATGASDLSGRLGDMMQAAIVGTRSKDAMLAFLQAVGALVPTPPSRDALRDLITMHVPAADQPDILAVLDVMTEADVSAFFADISGQARGAFGNMVGGIDLFVVACQESHAFQLARRVRGIQCLREVSRFLQSNTGSQAQMFDFANSSRSVPREGYHEPVQSDIPAWSFTD
jgi:pimeloyl-ACP methyl ester carboxylesterase